jgi:hypothetical protein
MITNSNRSGAVETRPEGRDHQSGKDVRSGKEATSPEVKGNVSVIKTQSNVRVRVKNGRLHIKQSK